MRRSSKTPVTTAHAVSPRFHAVFGVTQSAAKKMPIVSEGALSCGLCEKITFDELNDELKKPKKKKTAAKPATSLPATSLDEQHIRLDAVLHGATIKTEETNLIILRK